MAELKQAVVIIHNRRTHEVERVMCFEDHNDAVDVWEAYVGHLTSYASMAVVEHYSQGQKPNNIPLIQQALDL